MRKMTILFADCDADVRTSNALGYEAAKSRAEAEGLAPWAAEVVEVDGGWIAYESVEDARIAQQQT